jgi:Caspase domain/TIR domain
MALGNAHGLLVQVAAYRHVRPLPAVDDAAAIAGVLTDPGRGGYPPGNVRVLTDGDATRASLVEALDTLGRETDADSTVFVYFSGHGGRVEHGPWAGEYLLPVDAVYPDDASLAASAVSGDQFTAALAAIEARKVVVVFDCCHAGGVGRAKDVGARPLEAGLSDGYYDRLTAGRGRVIFASSRSTEYSYVPGGSQLGLFTAHLLDGLRGGAAGDDGYVRVFDLFEYVQPRVTVARRDQHPVFKAELEDNFAVAAGPAATSPPAPSEGDGQFRHDAYVSYAAADSAWVWGTLVPGLERAGVRVAVSDDVAEPGVARVVNAERGIRRSQRTVVVLTEAYLTDRMAEFENVLAQTMSVDEGRHRLIPVKAAPFDAARLPTRLSMLTGVDLSRPERAGRELDRLVRALQTPLSTTA